MNKAEKKAKAEWCKNATNAKLIASGYRVVSRRHLIVSRIDRPDWQAFCKENRYPLCADWYRRCLSKDQIEGISASALKVIPNSGDESGIQPYQEIQP